MTTFRWDYQFFAQDEPSNKLQTAPIVGDTPRPIVIDGLQILHLRIWGIDHRSTTHIDEDT